MSFNPDGENANETRRPVTFFFKTNEDIDIFSFSADLRGKKFKKRRRERRFWF